MDKGLKEEIIQLKKEKNAVILAHYYVDGEIQEIADYIGDSFYLSKLAVSTDYDTIIFCGVSFMGESAKLLNPDKTVLMPDPLADCPMAHMAQADKIKELRERYDDLAVVCYINSTAALKELSDVCVTSANALQIVKALPNKHIYFIPDENLGRYIASQLPEKDFIFNDGFCHVHTAITKDKILAAKDCHPNALVLMHPECTMEALEEADYIGSTSGILSYAGKSPCEEFVIATETGIFYELQKKYPDKHFYPVHEQQTCPGMKQITLEQVLACLKENCNPVEISDTQLTKANAPLTRMLELA